jgi:hypothetical protein
VADLGVAYASALVSWLPSTAFAAPPSTISRRDAD